jgi:hypothetical protein
MPLFRFNLKNHAPFLLQLLNAMIDAFPVIAIP